MKTGINLVLAILCLLLGLAGSLFGANIIATVFVSGMCAGFFISWFVELP